MLLFLLEILFNLLLFLSFFLEESYFSFLASDGILTSASSLSPFLLSTLAKSTLDHQSTYPLLDLRDSNFSLDLAFNSAILLDTLLPSLPLSLSMVVAIACTAVIGDFTILPINLKRPSKIFLNPSLILSIIFSLTALFKSPKALLLTLSAIAPTSPFLPSSSSLPNRNFLALSFIGSNDADNGFVIFSATHKDNLSCASSAFSTIMSLYLPKTPPLRLPSSGSFSPKKKFLNLSVFIAILAPAPIRAPTIGPPGKKNEPISPTPAPIPASKNVVLTSLSLL